MPWWFGLAVLVLVECATPKGTPTQVPMAGENWEVSTITRQELPEDADQIRWHYVLRLRDVSGAGLRLTQLTRSFPGIDTFYVLPQSASIDLRIEPNGVLDIPCWETLFRTRAAPNVSFTVKKTFTGQDGQGRPVTFAVELPFDTRDRAEPARLLEFAKFTARESSRIPPPHYCETVPNGIREVDRRHAVSLNFLIGIRIVYRAAPTQLRTRWFSPGGEVVKVIETELREVEPSGKFNVHATHSLPRELFREQPGEWKVELFVDGHNEGVYTIRVT